jgi:DNA adenine methylase
MRRFVVIGQKASASGDFLIDDVPGTSGRLDVLLRCVRASLLVSHGLRRDAVVYLVLQGGPRAPRVVRVTGADAKFVRPDERSLAILVKKTLASEADASAEGFVEVRPGIALARGGLDAVLADVGASASYLLEEGAPDLRDMGDLAQGDATFFVGDHLGIDAAARERLVAAGARPVGLGPVSLHAEDAIAVVSSEMDRRGPGPEAVKLTDLGKRASHAPVQHALESLPDEVARPFLKWAGGKRQLLPHLLKYVPARFGAYFEPFVGGGALFFALRPERATLADVNERLVRAYRGVADHVGDVMRLLSGYPHDSEFFYKLRAKAIDARSDAEVAAWFIYLNRTGYNGLYRVNRKNGFNVPFGRYANPTVCDEPTLQACSRALAGKSLVVGDFEAVASKAKRGDFVYFDPPYAPLSATSSFTSYTSGGFGPDDQRRLRDVASALKRRGVHVLLSNSSAPLIRELYEGFEVFEAPATRMLNSKGDGRGPIAELVIR